MPNTISQFAQQKKDNSGEIILLETDNFDGGSNPDADPTKLEANILATVFNVAYIRGQPYCRNGYNTISNGKPFGAVSVLNLYITNDSSHTGQAPALMAFGQANIAYANNANGWTALAADVGATLTGGATDYFSCVSGDGRTFFCNGVDKIQEINTQTNKFSVLGDAPSYKYLTMADNRLIGANLTGASADVTNIGWSGVRNYGEWNPATDITAGNTPLVTSPSDTDDDITGLFSHGLNLIIPRKRSIWVGTFLPTATNPFNFFAMVPRVGADCPRAIKMTEYGLVWFNLQNCSLYLWQPQTYFQVAPQDLLAKSGYKRFIQKTLAANGNLTNLSIYATYSNVNKTFTLIIPQGGGRLFDYVEYNFDNNTWTTGQFDGSANKPSTITDLDYQYNNSVYKNQTTRYLAAINGSIYYSPPWSGYANDVNFVQNDAFAGNISYNFFTKVIEAPPYITSFSFIRFTFTPFSATGILYLFYVADGNTVQAATIDLSTLTSGNPYVIQTRINVRARRFQLYLNTTSSISIQGFVVKGIISGELPDPT